MTKYNQPKDTDQTAMIAALEARIERLERAPRAVATSIDSGAFVLKNPNTGNTVMYVGTLLNGDYGVEIYRDDGSIALRVGRAFITDTRQIARLYNPSGIPTAGDQFLDPSGEYNFTTFTCHAISADPTFTTSSGSFVSAFTFRGIQAATVLQANLAASCSDGTTSGEMRLTDLFGTPLTGFLGASQTPVPIPIGTTSPTFFQVQPDATAIFLSNFGNFTEVLLQVRRTAGAGSITLVRPVLANKSA